MIPLILGGVALATITYALCEDGCDYFESSDKNRSRFDDEPSSENENRIKNSDTAKEFHKHKKYIYKSSMKEYENFLKKYEIKDSDIQTDVKLAKQKFTHEQISEELESYITQITSTLEILSQNLSTCIKELQDKTTLDETNIEDVAKYARSIYELSHVELFTNEDELNQMEILSTLVKTMAFTTNKNSLHVELDVA